MKLRPFSHIYGWFATSTNDFVQVMSKKRALSKNGEGIQHKTMIQYHLLWGCHPQAAEVCVSLVGAGPQTSVRRCYL
jgi:hypothetical protein